MRWRLVSCKVSPYRGFGLRTQRVVVCEMQKPGTLSQLYNEWGELGGKAISVFVCVRVCVRELILSSEYIAYNRIKHYFCLQCNSPWRDILPTFITVGWESPLFSFRTNIKYNLKNSHELNLYNRQQALQFQYLMPRVMCTMTVV